MNEYGQITGTCWRDLPNHYPHIELDEFVIMPNHIHGIVAFVVAPLAAPYIDVFPDSIVVTDKTQKKGAASSAPTLGAVIRAFKSISAIAVNRIMDRQGGPVWQRNYYEHIIRSEPELHKIREYIVNNPLNWEADENFKN